jgi:hypothetical protein
MTESGILSVIKRFPLATLILGALFLYSGAAGHWSISQFNVAIDDGAWRVVLGILGTALLAVSVYAYYLENKPPPPKVPNIVQPKEFREVYRVEIVSPKPGPIQAPFDVKGTCENLPPTGFKLWLFLLSKSGTEFYPQQILELKPTTGRKHGFGWEAKVTVKRWKPNDERRFQLYLVGPYGKTLVDHYFSAGKEVSLISDTARWPPLLDPLPKDIIPLGSSRTVRVTSVADQTPAAVSG